MLASSKLDVDSLNRKKVWLYSLQELGTYIYLVLMTVSFVA